jgi:transposase
MPATVIAERIGWSRGLTVLKERVRELRPVYLPPDPAGRTRYVAGEIAQHDFWFPDVELPVGFGQTRTPARLPVLTMVCGYSRWLSAVLIPSRTAEDLFAGWWRLLDELGAVPRVLVWDGEGAVGRWRAGRPELTGDCQGFRGTLGAKVLICKPADPEAKGLLERAHDWLERSFLPGRTFCSPAPAERIAADRAAMLALPPVAPLTGWRGSTRLPRDHYIRLDANDYSVHPAVIGRRVEVVADLARVRVFCDGQVVADHARVWARHQTISDPVHVSAARALRRERIGPLRSVPAPGTELDTVVETRCLAEYDTALGVDDLDRAPGADGGAA